MKILIVTLALVALCSAKTLHSQLNNYTFEDYIEEYKKQYEGEEYFLRRQIFEANLEMIQAHNSNPHASYKKGVNHFTDQTQEEAQKVNGYKKTVGNLLRSTSNAETFQAKGLELPASFDWRNVNPAILTPVKNQGHCGSCWTFSATGVLESHWALATGHLQEFSQQQIASCAWNPLHCGGHGGCSGGIPQIAFQHVINNGGIASEWTYPYVSYQGQDFSCAYNSTLMPPVAKFITYKNVLQNSYDALLEALVTEGPIAVSVDATTWHSYESGVFDGCDTQNPDINHAVVLVGYGTDSVHGDYWTIRNSWSPSYGEEGHIRIKRTKQGELCAIDKTPQDGSGCDGGPEQVTVCGMCGILYDNTFPVAFLSEKKFLSVVE